MNKPKRLITAIAMFSIMGMSNVQAANSVPYKNQKAGQFCKSVDVGKNVKLPDGSKLKCLRNGERARWTR